MAEPEVNLLANIGYKYALETMTNEQLRATIATLTTRAEQAEARVGDDVRVITQLQQRAQLAEARVVELEAALEARGHADECNFHMRFHEGSGYVCGCGFDELVAKGRAATEGQRG